MQLWNIQTKTHIHAFPHDKLVTSSSTSGLTSSITALCQSPAIDVVGVGFTSGEISVYDIRTDERLMRMSMEGGGIRALGFRTGALLFPQKATIIVDQSSRRWPANLGLRLFFWASCYMGFGLGRTTASYGARSTRWCDQRSRMDTWSARSRDFRRRQQHQGEPVLCSMWTLSSSLNESNGYLIHQPPRRGF